jgi:hypothetical protein
MEPGKREEACMHRTVMALVIVLMMAATAVAGDPAATPSATATAVTTATAPALTPTATPKAAVTGTPAAELKPGEFGRLVDKCTASIKALGGRVVLKMPPVAKIEPRQATSAFAASLADAEETRIILDSDRERMIILVTETYTTADKDFGQAVAKLFPDGSAQPMAKDAAEPRSYLVIPKSPKPGATATLAAMALMVLPDQSVVEVAAYVNAEARKDLRGATQLATAILTGTAAGDVTLGRKGEVKRVPLEFEQRLLVPLPPDWVMTVVEGEGGMIYYVRPITVFGRRPPILDIFVSEYPSYLHSKLPGPTKKGDPKPEFKQADGPFLGVKQRWFIWTTGTGAEARQHTEVMSDAGDRLIVHVHYAAETDAEMQSLRKIVDGMTKVGGEADRAWSEMEIPLPAPTRTEK